MTAERSERRRRRARTVRGLARLFEATGAANDERRRVPTWRTLDELPDWCALDPATRGERCVLAGAVTLQPTIRRCLDGKVLSCLRERLGAERFEALRRRPYRAFARAAELPAAPALERRLLENGVRALVAGIDDSHLRALLSDALRAECGLESGERDPDSSENATDGDRTGTDDELDVDPHAAFVAAELHAESASDGAMPPSASPVRPSAP